MSAGFTPGPWLRDTASGIKCDVRSASGRAVALCWGLSTSKAAKNNAPAYRAECNANAELIASAPDLLAERDKLKAANAELAEALQGMVEVFGVSPGATTYCHNPVHGWIDVPVNDVLIEVSELARAALAKNKGTI